MAKGLAMVTVEVLSLADSHLGTNAFFESALNTHRLVVDLKLKA